MMGRKRKPRELLRDATQAHADLNTFAAIVALLESGLNSSATFTTANRIIKLAKAEQGRALVRMDTAAARMGAPYRDVP